MRRGFPDLQADPFRDATYETHPVNPHSSGAIRIVFCITELEPGGAERSLFELVKRLDRQQFEPLVYCLGPRPAGNPSSLADALERENAPVHCFGARRLIEFPRVLWMLRRQLRIDRPQIVQTFLFHANVLGALAARLANVPHVVSGIRVAEHRKAWHLVLARWTDRWVERHVCVSQSVRDFSEQHGLSASKLTVIPNGVDFERFAGAKPASASRLRILPGRRVIAYVGRLDEQKGLAWLLKLLPQVFVQLPKHDLVVVGSGPERDRLVQLVEELGLRGRVHFLRFRDDVPEILAASELLVLPSRWEGMPNAVLEAMASSKPVVATRVEGVEELLGPAAEDQSVPQSDAEAFTAKVIAILSDPALAARLGTENRSRAQSCFSLESMTTAYERLYRELVAANR